MLWEGKIEQDTPEKIAETLTNQSEVITLNAQHREANKYIFLKINNNLSIGHRFNSYIWHYLKFKNLLNTYI